jgi:hypothetical protein
VATGFVDPSAFLRELTLKSMLTLAPKVSKSESLLFLKTGSTLLEMSLLKPGDE